MGLARDSGHPEQGHSENRPEVTGVTSTRGVQGLNSPEKPGRRLPLKDIPEGIFCPSLFPSGTSWVRKGPQRRLPVGGGVWNLRAREPLFYTPESVLSTCLKPCPVVKARGGALIRPTSIYRVKEPLPGAPPQPEAEVRRRTKQVRMLRGFFSRWWGRGGHTLQVHSPRQAP